MVLALAPLPEPVPARDTVQGADIEPAADTWRHIAVDKASAAGKASAAVDYTRRPRRQAPQWRSCPAWGKRISRARASQSARDSARIATTCQPKEGGVIEVQSFGQRFVLEPAASNAEANRRNVLRVTSGFVWQGGEQLAAIGADGLYGLRTKQRFAAPGEDGKPSYLDGQSLYLRFELVNGGVRISGDSHPDAIAKFKRHASGSEG